MDEKTKNRLFHEALDINEKLIKENRELREAAALWHNLFDELLAYHFAEGGSAPNLRFDRTTRTTEPVDSLYELINNNEYLTVVPIARLRR